MKKLVKSLMCLATVAMAFTACQKEESVSLPETLKLTVDAVAEELASDARTYIDNSNNILWGKGEQMTIALMDAEPQFVKSTSTDEFDGLAQATFAFEITPGENSTYTYGGVYPASASDGISNSAPAAYKVALPATQKATATSYDPSAYIMLAKPIVANEAQTSLQMSYGRITALNKITLTGLNTDVTSVTITLPDGQNLAGRRYLDLTQGSAGEVYYDQTPSITVDYDTALTGATKDVWFTSWHAVVAAGEQMTIKATTATHTYTRTITANSNGISFKEGHLNTLSVNMAADGVVVEALADYSGSYLIVAKQPTGYYAMSTEAEGTRRAPKLLENYEAFADAAYPTNDATIQWTVTKNGANYTISNGEQYLSWSSGNTASLSTDPYALKIDFDGTYTISSVGDPTRILAKNTTAATGFAFYTGSGTNKLYLKEFVADTRTALTAPSVTAEAQDSSSIVVSWNTVSGAANYTVTCGSSAPVVVEGTTHTFTDLAPSTEYTISVVANPANVTAYKPSAAGTATATTQAAAAGTKFYKQLTNSLSDYSGKYLLVYNNGSKTGYLSSISTSSTKYGLATDVTITSNGIASNNDVDTHQVIIEKVSEGYTLKFGEKYLYWGSGNSLNVRTDAYTWVIAANDADGVRLVVDPDEMRILWWNNGSTRFACYTGKQHNNGGYTYPILYKLEE